MLTSPTKPQSRRGGRPASQREGMRRSLGTWRFVTAEASSPTAAAEDESPLATRSEAVQRQQSRRSQRQGNAVLAASAGSQDVPWMASFGTTGSATTVLPTPPSTRDGPPPSTSARGLQRRGAPAGLEPLALASTATTASAPERVGDTVLKPNEPMREYSPSAASGGVELDVVPSTVEYKPGPPALSLTSVINAAVEGAEATCDRARPWASDELARRLVDAPEPEDSEPHCAALPTVPPPTPGELLKTLPATPRLDRRRPVPETQHVMSNQPRPRPVATVEQQHTLRAPVPSSSQHLSKADLNEAKRELEQRRARRIAAVNAQNATAVGLPAMTSAHLEAGLNFGPASDDEVTSAGDRPASLDAGPEERRVRFSRQGQVGSTVRPKRSQAGSPTRRTSAVVKPPGALQPPSPTGGRRSTVSRRSTVHSTASFAGSGQTSPTGRGDRSSASDTDSANQKTEWIAAGGFSRDEPLYKMLHAAISDMKSEFGFVEPNEIRAIDGVLLGLQHAHVHRLFRQMHSLGEVAPRFLHDADAPVEPQAPTLMRDTHQLVKASRVATDIGRRTAPQTATKPKPHSRAKTQQDRTPSGAATARAASGRGAPTTSWAAHVQRDAARRERDVQVERELTEHFQLSAHGARERSVGPASSDRTTTPTSDAGLGRSVASLSASQRHGAATLHGSQSSVRAPPLARRTLASLSDAAFEALLEERTVHEPDMVMHQAQVHASEAIADATPTISRFVDHLRLVMPPEDAITYPSATRSAVGGSTPAPRAALKPV